jgi:hypothetical protein
LLNQARLPLNSEKRINGLKQKTEA